MLRRISVVVIARNEEETIAETLKSVREQSLRPYVIVVDDGSIDSTGSIAEELADYVVKLPHHEESWAGKPELAKVFNAGFKVASETRPDYVMVSGADTVYPPNYLEVITKAMEREGVVIASGVPVGERAKFPRGSGRVIDAEWFGKIGFSYPENWGFEAYVVFKALQMRYKVKTYPVQYKLLRKTGMNPRKAYYWGKAMKALGYWPPYAMGRALLWFFHSPRVALSMIRGYMEHNTSVYHDVCHFVREYQKKYFLRLLHVPT